MNPDNEDDLIRLIEAKIYSSTMTVRDIAARSKLSHSSLYRFLNGECKLRHDAFVSLLNTLGIDLKPLIRKSLKSETPKDIEEISESLGSIYSSLNDFKRRAFIRSALTFASLNASINLVVKRSMNRLEIADRSISVQKTPSKQ